MILPFLGLVGQRTFLRPRGRELGGFGRPFCRENVRAAHVKSCPILIQWPHGTRITMPSSDGARRCCTYLPGMYLLNSPATFARALVAGGAMNDYRQFIVEVRIATE